VYTLNFIRLFLIVILSESLLVIVLYASILNEFDLALPLTGAALDMLSHHKHRLVIGMVFNSDSRSHRVHILGVLGHPLVFFCVTCQLRVHDVQVIRFGIIQVRRLALFSSLKHLKTIRVSVEYILVINSLVLENY